jgi:hypothetical protein
VSTDKPLTLYQQARNELLDGIPGLLDMGVQEGLLEIDRFVVGWKSPAITFNPWQYFQSNRPCQRYPVSTLVKQH